MKFSHQFISNLPPATHLALGRRPFKQTGESSAKPHLAQHGQTRCGYPAVVSELHLTVHKAEEIREPAACRRRCWSYRTLAQLKEAAKTAMEPSFLREVVLTK